MPGSSSGCLEVLTVLTVSCRTLDQVSPWLLKALFPCRCSPYPAHLCCSLSFLSWICVSLPLTFLQWALAGLHVLNLPGTDKSLLSEAKLKKKKKKKMEKETHSPYPLSHNRRTHFQTRTPQPISDLNLGCFTSIVPLKLV